jgi:WhiB family transcriptional regulator, redox-sensing transcriptional regulator
MINSCTTTMTPKENCDTEPCAPRTDQDNAAFHGLSSRRTILVKWRDSAACLDVGPELFFPIGNTFPALVQIEEAKAVCGRCEVVETCLAWAMEARQDSGVWGGMSADERRTLKRRKARASRAV